MSIQPNIWMLCGLIGATSVLGVCAFPQNARAADSLNPSLFQLQHTSWTEREGAPPKINDIAQAPDGSLWLGSGERASTVETNDLAVAIKNLGGELAAEGSGHSSAGLSVEVEGTSRTLHPIVRDEIYRIAGEALRNAFRHAEANQIEVELHYDEQQLRLRIRDDGKGIDPQFLTSQGREGHFGMHGMRERAKLISGKLTVWTAPGSGTEIELSVPAVHAYAASSAPWRSWFTEKFARRSSNEQPSQSDSDSVD